MSLVKEQAIFVKSMSEEKLQILKLKIINILIKSNTDVKTTSSSLLCENFIFTISICESVTKIFD